MSITTSSHRAADLVMHLVLGHDNVSYETGPLSFNEVVDMIRGGHFVDIYRVLSLSIADSVGLAADVTREAACAIYAQSFEHPISYGSEAFEFVERELSCQHAEECAWEDAAERYHDRIADYRISERHDA